MIARLHHPVHAGFGSVRPVASALEDEAGISCGCHSDAAMPWVEFYFGTVISPLLEVAFPYTFSSKCRKDNVHAPQRRIPAGGSISKDRGRISPRAFSESFAVGINKGINLVSGLCCQCELLDHYEAKN